MEPMLILNNWTDQNMRVRKEPAQKILTVKDGAQITSPTGENNKQALL